MSESTNNPDVSAEQAAYAQLNAWEKNNYQGLRQHELAQEKASAQQAAARDKANKARLAYNPLRHSTNKKGKK